MFWIATICLGCAKPPPPTERVDASQQVADVEPLPASPKARVPAIPLLRRVYDQADGYSDEMVMSLTYHFEGGRKETTATTVTTRYAPPNRLNVRVASEDNQVSVVSDGQQLVARIIDPITNDFDGQVVVRDSPDRLSIADLYEATELIDPIAPQEKLSALLGAPASLDMTALGLLLRDGRLFELINDNSRLKDRGTNTLPETGVTPAFVECQIVEAAGEEGSYRLWIDSKTNLLRRIDFPPTTSNLPPGLSRMELIAEIRNPHLQSAASDFAASDDGQQVSHFVLPPLPPSTDLLGTSIPSLVFSDDRGKSLTIDNDPKELAVLTWFHDHPASRFVIQQLDSVCRRLNDSRVTFVPVYVGQSGDQILTRWGIGQKQWLDPNTMGLTALGVKEAPTTVVLAGGNSVQHFEVGANPGIADGLALVLRRLLAGEDVAKEALEVDRLARQAYQRQLTLAKSGDGWVEQVEVELPAASQPARLALIPKWTNGDVTEPGNLLIVPGTRKQILVVDGWNRLVLIHGDGKTERQIPMDLPDGEGITLLRAGKDETQRALVAAATRGGRQVFVFDFDGRLVTRYPRIPNAEATVTDLAIADLDGDDKPEIIIGWQGKSGVQGVSLDGKRLWTNRASPNVNSLALIETSSKNRKSVVVAGGNNPVLLDDHGRTLGEVSVGQPGIHQVATWPGSARGFDAIMSLSTPRDAGVYCCFSMTAAGEALVLGTDRQWKSRWSHTLPAGVFRHQLDQPQSVTLPVVGPTWLFAGPDGSVHFVSADGKFTDHFNVGRHLRGIAGMNVGDAALLLIATDGELSAWSLEMLPRQPSSEP